MSASPKIVLTREINVGTGDATDEADLLKSVFLDTGYTAQLIELNNPKCIILGPTGVGKTALMQHVANTQPNIVQIRPDDLLISHINNSSIIQDMERCDVNLSAVFRYMWQHLLLTELIRLRFTLKTPNAFKKFIDKFKNKYVDASAEYQAISYLEKGEAGIWEEMGHRVTEMRNSIENAIGAQSGTNTPFNNTNFYASSNTTTDKKEMYETLLQTYMNDSLIKTYKKVRSICDSDFFQKENNAHYMVIDDLDKDWAPSQLRNILLKALLLAVKELNTIKGIKIILGLREDIKHALFRETPTRGFQEDKFESLEMRLAWDKTQLKSLASKRIDKSFKDKYTNRTVTLEQIFENFQIEKKTPIDYMISRTRYRPRELILFINSCIGMTNSNNQNTISRDTLLKAESIYSGRRIQAVHDEWSEIFPCIKIYFNLLKRKPAIFSFGRFLSNEIRDFENAIVSDYNAANDPIGKFFIGTNDTKEVSAKKVLRDLIKIYYQCGIVGIKLDSHTPTMHALFDEPMIEDARLNSKSKIYVEPAFFQSLGIDKSVDRLDI